MVELRKRKAPPPPPVPAKKKAATGTGRKPGRPKKTEDEKPPAEDAKKKADEKPAADEKEAEPAAPTAGATIELDGFGGEVETNDGKKTTLKQLVEESKAGVVLFTYPKANTPGCTVQACGFRDGHETLTSTGLTIYGLSSDSPKSNTTFKTKQSLPYTLLCNPSYSLIGAIGMQQGSAHKTKRGVFAVDKQGKVLLATTGGPTPTVDAVKKLVDGMEK